MINLQIATEDEIIEFFQDAFKNIEASAVNAGVKVGCFIDEFEFLKFKQEQDQEQHDHTFKCAKNNKIKGRHAKPFYSKGRW